MFKNTTEFLENLYNKTDKGFALLWTLSDKKSYFFDLSQGKHIQNILNKVEAEKSNDVYIGVGILGESPKSGRGKEKDVIGLTGFCLDIDYGCDGKDINKKYPSNEEEALTLIKEMELEPTCIIHTGNGYHAWWFSKSHGILKTMKTKIRLKNYGRA